MSGGVSQCDFLWRQKESYSVAQAGAYVAQARFTLTVILLRCEPQCLAASGASAWVLGTTEQRSKCGLIEVSRCVTPLTASHLMRAQQMCSSPEKHSGILACRRSRLCSPFLLFSSVCVLSPFDILSLLPFYQPFSFYWSPWSPVTALLLHHVYRHHFT